MISKIAVIKAVAASQLVCFVVNNIMLKIVERNTINDVLFKFLWDYKGNKIKGTEMIGDCHDGGQRVLDREWNLIKP